MSKAIKITTASGATYLMKLIGDDLWGAYGPEDEHATYEFSAPEDASSGELTGAVDYLEMTSDTVGEDDYENENDYDYV